MSTKIRLREKMGELPTWQKVALGVAGVAAYAVAQGGVVVAVGEVLVVAGPAARVLAARA